MKKTVCGVCVIVSVTTGRVEAQMAVVDSAQIKQNVVQHLEDIARFATMIEHQIQQITTLTQQLAQLNFVSAVLGNPGTNQTLSGILSVFSSVSEIGASVSRSELLAGATAAIAHFDNGRGIFRAVGDSFRDSDGHTVKRQLDIYKPLAAVIQTTVNHDAVYENVLTRRRGLREGLRDTLQQLRAAMTDAESQKLQGVLIGQVAELAATDHEADFATQRSVIQDIANRNDRLRQEEARREEQVEEMSKSMKSLIELLQPNTRPIMFSQPR